MKKDLEEIHLNRNDGLGDYLESLGYSLETASGSILELLRRPGVELVKLLDLAGVVYDPQIARQVEIEVKYEGYIQKARKEADKMRRMDQILLPQDLDYLHIDNLALEARAKLDKIRPVSLGQASRISGINPSDLQVLAIYLKQRGQGNG